MPVAVIERSERLAPKVTRGWKRKRTAWSKEEWRGGREAMGWVATVPTRAHTRAVSCTGVHFRACVLGMQLAGRQG